MHSPPCLNGLQSVNEAIQPSEHHDGEEVPWLNLLPISLVLTEAAPLVLKHLLEVEQNIQGGLGACQTLRHISFQNVLRVQVALGLGGN